MSLHLMNDDVNSFQHVMEVLKANIPLCNSLRAEQIAHLVHKAGECQIHTGFPPEIYIIYAQLQKEGLKAQLKIIKNENSN